MAQLSTFDDIFDTAANRKGGAANFEKSLSSPRPAKELAAIPDGQWLSAMSRCVFQAGFNWKVVENKWPRFDEVFQSFDIGRMSVMSDDDLDRYLKTDGIIRHATKILSIRDNALFIRELVVEHGGAGATFANWPSERFVDLLWMLKKRGCRLGGATAMYFLRGMSVDGFILSRDVGRALVREGVVDKDPKSKRDLDAVQAAFNVWHEQSGRPLTHISRVLACSVE